jgi:hypothetical protein
MSAHDDRMVDASGMATGEGASNVWRSRSMSALVGVTCALPD